MTDTTTSETARTAEADIPSAEPWLKLLLASPLPLALGIALPRALLIPLSVLSGLLFLASLVLFARQRSGERARAD